MKMKIFKKNQKKVLTRIKKMLYYVAPIQFEEVEKKLKKILTFSK